MVSVLDSGVVEYGFEHSPVKDYKISIFSFSAKHTTLMSKGKDLVVIWTEMECVMVAEP
jgi:hypothetical protein